MKHCHSLIGGVLLIAVTSCTKDAPAPLLGHIAYHDETHGYIEITCEQDSVFYYSTNTGNRALATPILASQDSIWLPSQTGHIGAGILSQTEETLIAATQRDTAKIAFITDPNLPRSFEFLADSIYLEGFYHRRDTYYETYYDIKPTHNSTNLGPVEDEPFPDSI